MADPLSPEDAVDESAEWSGEYDSLEERIVKSERPEDEIRKSVRLERWQWSQIEIITHEINTSKTEVAAKSYISGLKQARDEATLDEVREISGMRSNIQRVAMSYMDIDPASVQRELQELEVELQSTPQGELWKPYTVPIPESVVSEVSDDYITKISFDSGFHRVLIGIGLGYSEHSTPCTDENCNIMIESLNECIKQSRVAVEKAVSDWLSTSMFHIENKGIDPDMIELLIETKDMMGTDHKDRMEYHLEEIL